MPLFFYNIRTIYPVVIQMVSKITYGDKDWKNDLRKLWKKTKLTNMNVQLFPSISGRENVYLTTANVLKLNNKAWELYDLKTSIKSLVFLIDELMKTEERITILINVFQFRDGEINTANLTITTEQITIEKPTPSDESYLSALDAVSTIEFYKEMGYFLSNEEAKNIIKDFNIKLRCESGDKPDEESALFVYERKVMRIRQRSNGGWVIYRVGTELKHL